MTNNHTNSNRLGVDGLTGEEFRAYTLVMEELSLHQWIQHINEWDAKVRRLALIAKSLAFEISMPPVATTQLITDQESIQWEVRATSLKKPKGNAYICSRMIDGEIEYAMLETYADDSPDGSALVEYCESTPQKVLQYYLHRELHLNREGIDQFIGDAERFLKSIVTCDSQRVLQAIRERFKVPPMHQIQCSLFDSYEYNPIKKATMKITSLASLLVMLLFGVGCIATRPASAVVLGAGGAALANELSDGDPLITTAGAAGGVIVSEGLHYAARKQSEKAYTTGYEKGRSDAVKQQYWLMVRQQRTQANDPNIRFYEIPLPEQTIDGVIFQPTTKYLRIEE